MSSETVVLSVKMSCTGCSGVVNRVLEKMQGVESFEIDMKEQKVTVKGNVKPRDVFDTVSKTGKKTSFWVEPGNKSIETPTETEPESKPLEVAAIAFVESDNKPEEAATEAELENKFTETVTIGVVEPDNKPYETATVVA